MRAEPYPGEDSHLSIISEIAATFAPITPGGSPDGPQLFLRTSSEPDRSSLEYLSESGAVAETDTTVDNEDDRPKLDLTPAPRERLDALTQLKDEARKFPRMTEEEERTLTTLLKAGDIKARNQMIEATIPLVIYLAKDYVNLGVEKLDLIQAGFLGLVRNAEKFAPEKGYSFGEFARLKVKDAMRQLINERDLIHLSDYTQRLLKKVDKTSRQLAKELGREPTTAEIADATGLDSEKVQVLAQATIASKVASLDEPLHAGEEGMIGDRVADPRDKIEETERTILIKDFIHRVLGDELAISVIEKRFALNGEPEQTQEEVARSYNLDLQEVKQIEADAMAKFQQASTEISEAA